MPSTKRLHRHLSEIVNKRWHGDDSHVNAEDHSHEVIENASGNTAVDTLDPPLDSNDPELVTHTSKNDTLLNQSSSEKTQTKARIIKKTELINIDPEINSACSNEYIFVDFSQLSKLLVKVKCSECNEDGLEFELHEQNIGFARRISLVCKNCELIGLEKQKSEIFTSKRVSNSKVKWRPFEVNLRLCTAFTFFGKGYSSVEQFSMIMNMKLFSNSSYDNYMVILSESAKKSCQKILDECRKEAKELNQKISNETVDLGNESEVDDDDQAETVDKEIGEILDEDIVSKEINKNQTVVKDDIVNAAVTYDGSWPTKGHTSKHGFAAAIDILSGYILDYDIVSTYCLVCKIAAEELGSDSPDFYYWYLGHASDCAVNHKGSSGGMETTIAEIIWKRSVNYGFRFTTMLSDGDSKTFKHLNSLNIYGSDFPLTKEECVNHVSKRFVSCNII